MSPAAAPGRQRSRKIGLVLAACAACCAGPVLAAIVGVGTLASVLAFVVWPALGLLVAGVTVALAARRARRHVGIGRSTH